MTTSPKVWNLTPNEESIYFRFSNLSLPRHTSYPSAPAWEEAIPSLGFEQQLGLLAKADQPVSIYIHVPFCEKLCSYCACNRLILGKPSNNLTFVRSYLDKVKQEITYNLSLKADKWQVAQLHLGGGTPTYLTPAELDELLGFISPYVEFTPDAELAVEIDPRVTTNDHLKFLRQAGFNRVSLGIQDFDPDVQKAVNRIQPFEMIKEFMAACRDAGFPSINFDLIYGLPLQTLHSIDMTLNQVLALNPDRIAFYRLALIPEVFKWQRTFSRTEVPEGRVLLEMFLNAINFLTTNGYQFVGLDHFVKPHEALHKAAEEKTLRRSFQGMTTGAELPIIGFGPSAISSFPNAFIQRLPDYYKWNREPVNEIKKGLLLNQDDLLRRWVIETLYCYRSIDKQEFKSKFNEDFDAYFHKRHEALKELEGLGLIRLSPTAIEVTAPLGVLLIRVVASVFDAYLPENAFKEGIATTQASKIG